MTEAQLQWLAKALDALVGIEVCLIILTTVVSVYVFMRFWGAKYVRPDSGIS